MSDERLTFNPGTLAEIIRTPTDLSKGSEITVVEGLPDVDALIDKARAESRTGPPCREVIASVDSLPVARFLWLGLL